MKKKLIVLSLCLLMVFTFVSCNNSKGNPNAPIEGGYTSVSETTEEDIARFNKATGLDLTNVKLIATQIVAGTNYKYEYVDSEGNTKTVVIYEDLQGNLEVLE